MKTTLTLILTHLLLTGFGFAQSEKFYIANFVPPTGAPPQNSIINSSFTLNDYDFLPPPRWQLKNGNEYIEIQSPESGCKILIFTPQNSSGDLEKDVLAVFQTMYAGWQMQKTGREQYTLSKGKTPQGIEFFMMEATMGKLATDGSRYDGFEEGGALVIRTGTQIVIISVRHNSSMLAHGDCHRKYEYWRRFFNSFTVKKAVGVKETQESTAKRIIGKWSMNEIGVATGEYVFAANGNYASVGAIGSSTTTRDQNYEYLHLRSYAFQGDGSYSIAENRLTLKKRGTTPEEVNIRFDQVNHGGTGWKDRMHMLTRGRLGDNEARYEKQ